MSDPEATARIDSDAPRPARGRGREVQFAPGTIIADRYRISGILGAGGMGEVYRADDTKLGQTVALKFLPARLARDPILLERLHDEVRLGRQIAHPNVCRIYDIVDWEGAHFVAMEYVDGEDLSRLLRRIGRLAHDKAVDIARGIAAGLHAAHGKGILHRDLKPANIMIDSHGEARIMDFGLALAAEDDSQDGVISGTPAYMAPEQLAGHPATIQSDLYALGLVMYELFTGKRAHSARTLPERVRDASSEITTPSSHIHDIDPAVERIILRCLDPEPSQRPRAARQVIDALPGGDPLAVALAAGETPSPRMVAAAGTEGSLKPAVAWSLLAGNVILLIAILGLVVAGRHLQIADLTKPPEVQAERARAILRNLGIPGQRFVAYGFHEQGARARWIGENDHKPGRWERARRGMPLATFWLREEAQPLLDSNIGSPNPKPSPELPPQHEPGSTAVEIDGEGRLFSLRAIASPSWKPRPADWNTLLDAAGLRGVMLTPAEPRLLPPSYADARAAWTARHPGDGTPIRIEAASWRGVPVHFRILGPWDEPGVPFTAWFGTAFRLFFGTIIALAVVFGTVLTWRNLRMRRGDRRGAFRVAAALFILNIAYVLLVADHEPDVMHEMNMLVFALSKAALWGGMFWIVYVALEPYVRRRWPDRLISWVRLVGGSWRDPMAGRDLLIGIAGGLAHTLLIYLSLTELEHHETRSWSFLPVGGSLEILDNSLGGAGSVTHALATGIVYGMTMMVLLMLLTIVLRRRVLAVGAFFLVQLLGFVFSRADVHLLPWFILMCAITTLMTARFGLLAAVAAFAVFDATFHFPLPDSFDWYTVRALAAPLFVIALALWAFRTSLGDRKLFSTDALDL